MATIKVTKSFIDSIAPQSKDIFFWDTIIKGFGIKVTPKGRITFVLQKRLVSGKDSRITLGVYPQITVLQAREIAQKNIVKVLEGYDPNKEKKEARDLKPTNPVLIVTFEEVFKTYLELRLHKATTEKAYKWLIYNLVPEWLGMPIDSITKEMIISKYTEVGANSKGNANFLMSVLKTVFNFAIDYYDEKLVTINVVTRAFKSMSKFVIPRKTSYIKAHQLNDWVTAVLESKKPILRDYLLFLLFTGLRRREADSLKKENVDLKHRTFTIVETKNSNVLVLPMSDFVYELLSRRCAATDNYIFPSNKSSCGHLSNPWSSIKTITKKTGISFSIHDLRRTFLTMAECLDLSEYTLKRLVNHKTGASDVTAGYIILDIERLREPVQKIADNIIKHVPVLKEIPLDT